MTIYVTGGRGYIGTHLVELLKKKNEDVIIIDNKSGMNLFQPIEICKYLDISLEEDNAVELLYQEFSSTLNNIVIHLAGLKSVGNSMKNPSLYKEKNLNSTRNVLRAMEKASVSRMIFSSSAAVYGERSDRVNESSSTVPISNYGAIKLEEENLIIQASESFLENYAILRFFNVIGASKVTNREKKGENIFPKILQAIETNESFKIFGNTYETLDGTCGRDYIDVRDLTAGIYQTANYLRDRSIGILNLGSGTELTVLQIVKKVSTLRDLSYEFSPAREGDIANLVANIDKARDVIDWAPLYSIDESIFSSFSI